ncbi:miraculin-like [Prosopis cineraria]|uniref:miraculin-like n=1 Tax=Prosopis cineraria TaxID=364024 RepID=UPI00240F30A0|nr:miraculin-like [Prosopis cineraria]
MKTSLVALFVLLYALSMGLQSLLVAADDASPRQVVDTTGKVLRAGSNYYILPVAPIIKCAPHGRCWSRDAGFSLAGIGKYCPLDVVVGDRYRALPVTFTPLNPKKGVIPVYSDLNIQFSGYNKCPQSTVWKLDRFDASSNHWFVTTGGILGEPGWKIEEYGGDYKLVYCPSGCKSCRRLCKNVGVFVDEKGNNRVALTDAPYKVKFQEA